MQGSQGPRSARPIRLGQGKARMFQGRAWGRVEKNQNGLEGNRPYRDGDLWGQFLRKAREQHRVIPRACLETSTAATQGEIGIELDLWA